MVHCLDPESRVSCSPDLMSGCVSPSDRGGSTDDDGDFDELDNAPISWLYKTRNRENLETKKKNLEVNHKGLLDDVQEQDYDDGHDVGREEDDELGEPEEELNCNATSFRSGDLVWAKAKSSTWWPGWICRKSRGKFFVSFFGRKRRRYFRESDVLSFEKNFQAMWKTARGKSLEAIDSALVELGRRLVLGLTCPCRITLDGCNANGGGQQRLTKQIVVSREKVFQPVEVLRFVHVVAICPWIDGPETLSAVRIGAQVNAFRCYSSIKFDWIYCQTMRLHESGGASKDMEADSSYIQMQYDHSSDDEVAYPVTQEAEVLNGEQEDTNNIFLEHVEGDLGICTEKRVGPLHEILTYLCCLALDPFYTGTMELQAEKPISVCQKILKYRELVQQKNLGSIPGKHAIYHDHKAGISWENEMSTLNSVSHVGSVTAEALPEQNIGLANGNSTHASQPSSNICDSSKAVINEKREVAKADCSLTCMEEVPAVVTDFEDAVAPMIHTPDHIGETQIKTTREILRLDSVLQLCETVTEGTENDKMKESPRVDSVFLPCRITTKTHHKYSKTENDDTHGCMLGSETVNDDTHESRFLSCMLGDLVTVHHCNMNGIDEQNMDMKVDFHVNHVLEASPREIFENDMDCDDKVEFHADVTRQNQQSTHLTDNLIKNHPSNEIGSVTNMTKRGIRLGITSECWSKKKTRPRRSASGASDFSVSLQQDKTLHPWKKLYASPLSRDSPVSNVNANFQSSMANFCSECPTSLHMKFPKDFKLPSKHELFKLFRPFGPLDYSKTRVFFYTGSAQVVFLHHLDAGTAYHYAKRKKFFGQANVLFWLVRHPNLKMGVPKISTPLSSAVESSVLSLKSCLKTSNSEENKNKRKLHHVKFATGS